jgi:hypothetical protein
MLIKANVLARRQLNKNSNGSGNRMSFIRHSARASSQNAADRSSRSISQPLSPGSQLPPVVLSEFPEWMSNVNPHPLARCRRGLDGAVGKDDSLAGRDRAADRQVIAERDPGRLGVGAGGAGDDESEKQDGATHRGFPPYTD